ncbi:MAG: MBL fold metallo-hydrolase [Eubacteriaceae bacterium]|nr:MBL fold metallo-hydrolase [Eubacteriaceae bacterium]
MIRITPLYSGSSGNCILVESDGLRVLVDAGNTAKKISEALGELGLSLCDISGIFVTHEHTDHVAGLGVIGRKAKIPVYMNEATWRAVEGMKGAPAESLVRIFTTGEPVAFHDSLLVESFHTSHDAAESVGYVFSDGVSRAGISTDTGVMTREAMEKLAGCGGVLIEANHDVDMLRTGSYPPVLKQRILSERGHLSNDDCGAALRELVASGCTRVILGHLSRENNMPLTALNTVCTLLGESGIKRNADYLINVARRDGITDGFEF